jgi:hypothetical protein
MEQTVISVLGALAGVAAGFILSGAARRRAKEAPVVVRADEPVRRRRRKA